MPFTAIRMWIRALLLRSRVETEMEKEMRLHLEMETEANIRAGMSTDEARRVARLAFGGFDRAKEDYRDAFGTRLLDETWRDARHALRSAWRVPTFTVTALTLLALAVGTAGAIFSVAWTVLVRPLPYPEADRLVFVAETNGSGVAWPNYDDWRSRATSFDGLAASLADAVIDTSGQFARRLDSRSVTVNFFRVLGISSYRGRLFDESDARPDAVPTVVVSHAYWMRELGGSTDAIGKVLSLNRRPFTVIGILPPKFQYMTPADVYRLIEPQIAANYRGMQSRGTHTTLFAVGRVKPAVSVAEARTEMQTIASALAAQYPESNKDSRVHLESLAERVVGDMAATLAVVAGAVALLLLIACVNLASLLLNRSAARVQEFSVRAAIGGSQWRLIRQLIVELALLVGTGGVLGALVGASLIVALVNTAPRNLPRLDEIHVDPVMLAWTTLACCIVAFLFGIVPALKAAGITGRHQLALRSGRRSTPSTTSWRRRLMIAEIAVATVLLAGAGLMVHTMWRLARVDPGFDPSNLQTLSFSLSGAQWPDERKQLFYDVMAERLRGIRGVENAALAYVIPTWGSNWGTTFFIEGHTGDADALHHAYIVPVTATYFETLRMPLLKGRYFDRSETPGSMPVAIVNDRIAKRYWPDDDPIGKQIQLGRPADPFGPWRTIVGVVGDIKQHGMDQETPEQLYLPAVQVPRTTMVAIVRTRGPVPAASLEAAIHDLDRSIPVFGSQTVDDVMREAASRRRVAMVVLSLFGVVAVFLAAIGLYGVIAQSVVERRNEIGIRVSLGATESQVVRMFLRSGVVAAVMGLALGVVASIVGARSLQTLVFGVSPTDPMTLAAVVTLLAVVSLAACYVPARSAARVDPVEALRVD